MAPQHLPKQKKPVTTTPQILSRGHIIGRYSRFLRATRSTRRALSFQKSDKCGKTDVALRWNLLDSLLVGLSIFEEIYGRVTIDQHNRFDVMLGKERLLDER